MFIIIFLLLQIIEGQNACKYKNQIVNASQNLNTSCQFVELTNCDIVCDQMNMVELSLLSYFTIIDSTIFGCDQFSLSTDKKGIINNLTILNQLRILEQQGSQQNLKNLKIYPPQLLYFKGDSLEIENLKNNNGVQSCIFISNKFTLQDTIQCASIVIHQQLGDLVLSGLKIISSDLRCLTQPTIYNLMGFVEIIPKIENSKFSTQANISVDRILKRLNKKLTQLHYDLVSPLSINQSYTILVLAENGSASINKDTIIEGSKIGLFARSMEILGNVSSPIGCLLNQGPGRGVSFQYEGAKCAGSGGSSAGYGGSGMVASNYSNTLYEQNEECFILEQAVSYMVQLNPYNGYQNAGSGSGGGEQYEMERITGDLKVGAGGGYIKIEVEENLLINGYLITDGQSGYQSDGIKQIFSGAGAGGSIQLSASSITGNGTASARGGDSDYMNHSGEGGGGLIRITLYNWETIERNKENQVGFNGSFNVSKGKRNLILYSENDVKVNQFLGSNGIIIYPSCPQGQEFLTKSLLCTSCQDKTYSFTLNGKCDDCPGVPKKNQDGKQCVSDNCNDFNCDPLKFITSFITSLLGILCYVTLFIVVICGYMIRRMYRLKEAHVEKLPFDFESATKNMVITHIITDTLRTNPEFQLVDLMYHAHRIVLQGSNSYHYPWTLSYQPSEEIKHIVDLDEWNKFTSRINKLAEWYLWEYWVLVFFAIFYYPFYWVMVRYFKKRKYKRIKIFVHNTDIKLWKFLNAEEQVFIKLKISKSADYTLLYLDIFNYKNSDLKYLFLACPYIILLSGEGSYVRPFYLCESDPFLSCLYFAINKSVDHDQDDERYRIMENLVAHKKRMENSARMNKFLLKFNRYARTIDYGSSSQIFSQCVQELLFFLKSWNDRFFSKLAIRLDLVVIQTPTEGTQQITILEDPFSIRFDGFMREIHQKYTQKQIQDVKFGIFIYDTDMDVNDIDDAFNQQKISFFEQPRANSLQNFEQDQEEEVNINDLKDQYINRTNTIKNQTTQGLLEQQKQTSQSYLQKHKKQNRQPTYHKIASIFDRIRYSFASHRLTSNNKYTVILLQLVLAFVDAVFLPIFLIGNIKELSQSQLALINFQFLLIPFPLVMFIAPFIGCLWMSTQSYGIAKLHLVFTSMSLFNLGLNILLRFTQSNSSTIAMLIQITDLIVKVGLILVGKCILSINVKLNKLNQAKHMTGS